MVKRIHRLQRAQNVDGIRLIRIVDKQGILRALINLGDHMSDTTNWEFVKRQAHDQNAWFEPKFVDQALETWAAQLQREPLEAWMSSLLYSDNPKVVGIVMAGNIPMVGLHDLICVLATGHRAKVKLSSDDRPLMKEVIAILSSFGIGESIEEAQNLKEIDAVIATGSNNSSRYFQYYFKDIPKVIRKNRSSVAVVESLEVPEIHEIGKDIFNFFGKGCMNVSKVYLKRGCDIVTFIDGLEGHAFVADNHRYHSNYTYHKALFLMNKEKHLDNGFLLLKQDEGLHSPLGCLFYEFYDNSEELYNRLETKRSEIQLIVNENTAAHVALPQVRFGQSQANELDRYADNVDIPSFLGSI